MIKICLKKIINLCYNVYGGIKMKIKNVIGRQILDSRGNPTVEVDVILDNGVLP